MMKIGIQRKLAQYVTAHTPFLRLDIWREYIANAAVNIVTLDGYCKGECTGHTFNS